MMEADLVPSFLILYHPCSLRIFYLFLLMDVPWCLCQWCLWCYVYVYMHANRFFDFLFGADPECSTYHYILFLLLPYVTSCTLNPVYEMINHFNVGSVLVNMIYIGLLCQSIINPIMQLIWVIEYELSLLWVYAEFQKCRFMMSLSHVLF